MIPQPRALGMPSPPRHPRPHSHPHPSTPLRPQSRAHQRCPLPQLPQHPPPVAWDFPLALPPPPGHVAAALRRALVVPGALAAVLPRPNGLPCPPGLCRGSAGAGERTGSRPGPSLGAQARALHWGVHGGPNRGGLTSRGTWGALHRQQCTSRALVTAYILAAFLACSQASYQLPRALPPLLCPCLDFPGHVNPEPPPSGHGAGGRGPGDPKLPHLHWARHPGPGGPARQVRGQPVPACASLCQPVPCMCQPVPACAHLSANHREVKGQPISGTPWYTPGRPAVKPTVLRLWYTGPW